MDALTTPLNWQKVRIGDICEITTGSLDANEMVHYGKYRFYTCAKEYYFIDKYAFDTEAILISGNGAYVGYVHYYKGKFNAYQRTYVLDNFSEHIIFVKYFLTMFLQSHIQTNRNEGNTPYIVMGTLKDFEIPLPPLNEQIAIANILSALDRYLYALDALILKKEGVKKALSFELLSQRKRLKGFNQAWQRVKVKDFGIIITGSTPLTQISEYWNGTISWITPTDINDNKDIFNSERKITQKGLNTIRMIPKNSVLVTCIASIGKNAILRVNGACNQQINAIIPNKDFNADFIYYLMENNKQYLLGKAGVTATYIISKQVFEEIDFFVPKDLDEQIAISNILSGLDNEIISLKNKKRQFDNIKKALNHDLMSAKIRVLKK
ncbi:restriction endonuclease subunit S [Helicobacter pylori]|uniref:restriction endonuclease subunit S n=2 Tax=Helicobacter pylori TaxID=210 RepID=UPI0009A3B99E|nr:restriction endonuclease subunit S [Helicobacter pylori]OPG43520.1 type I restriction endonuclease subunit S [Helicobacter pylori]